MDKKTLTEIADAQKCWHHLNTGHYQQLRKQLGLSRQIIATELGVSNTAVTHWETGKTKPRRDIAAKYAELMHQLETRLTP